MIQNFSQIAALLISILKKTKLFKKLAYKVFKTNDNKVVRDISTRKANETIKNLFKFKILKNEKFKT